MKKLVSIFVCVFILIQSLFTPFYIFAEDTKEESSSEVEENIQDEIISPYQDDESSSNELEVFEEVLPEAFFEPTTVTNNKYCFNQTATNYSGPINGDYHYRSILFDENTTQYRFNYDDKWLIDDESYIFNYDLAKISLNLSMAGLNTTVGAGEDDAANLKNLYDQLGFTYTDNVLQKEELSSDDSIVYADSRVHFDYLKPENDTIGYGIAYKNVTYQGNTYTLVVVTIRGSGYDAEWASNFTAGETGDAYGFKHGAKAIQTKLHDYLNAIDTPYETKLWITGYSRGAAVANLCSYYLDLEACENQLYGVTPENIYTYTFECPMAKDTTSYVYKNYTWNGHTSSLDANIFNVLNYTDLMTTVAMDEMKFSRYGVNHYLPNITTISNFNSSSLFSNMVKSYRQLLDYGGMTLTDEDLNARVSFDVNTNALYRNLTTLLANVFAENGSGYRSYYVSNPVTNGQNVARHVGTDILGTDDRILKTVSIYSQYKNLAGKLKTTDAVTVDIPSLANASTSDFVSLFAELAPLLIWKDRATYYYITFKTTEADGSNAYSSVLQLTAKQFDYLYDKLKTILTMAQNDELGVLSTIASSVVNGHISEHVLAWMESGSYNIFKNQHYVQVKINKSNTSVAVKYNGNVVATLSEDNVSTSNQLEAYEGDDDYLYIRVPEDSAYTVEISTAKISSDKYIYLNTYNINDDSYSIQSAQYNLNGSAKNTTYIINCATYSMTKNGSSVNLSNVVKTSDKSDVTVSVTNDSSKGTISGGNSAYALYNTITLQATPKTPYVFVGWYDEKDRLLSTDLTYDYVARYSTTLTTKWRKKQYTVHFDVSSADSGEMQDITYEYGTNNVLPTNTLVKDRYKVSSWTIKDTTTSVTNSINIDDGIDKATITLVPNWVQYIFDIGYYLDGGINNISNPTIYEYDETATIALLDPSKEGPYYFLGWYDNANFEGNAITSIARNANKDLSLYAKFEYNPEKYVNNYVQFTNLSAILNEQVSLNIHMKLLDDTKLSNTTLKYQIGEGAVQEAALSSLNKVNNEYILPLKLEPKQIDTLISLTLNVDGEDGKTQQVSIEKYCEELEEEQDEEIVALSKAIINYGTYSDNYFGKIENVPLINDSSVKSQINKYKYTVNASTESENIMKLQKASLILDSKISIKIYISILDGSLIDSFDIAVKDIDSSRLEIKDNYILIKDIKASELLNYFNITISKNSLKLVEMSYSAMSYAKQVLCLSDPKYNNLKNLMFALYDYALAAKEYVENN